MLHSKCNQFTFVVTFNCLIEMFVCVSVIKLYAACTILRIAVVLGRICDTTCIYNLTGTEFQN